MYQLVFTFVYFNKYASGGVFLLVILIIKLTKRLWENLSRRKSVTLYNLTKLNSSFQNETQLSNPNNYLFTHDQFVNKSSVSGI